jgi:hypothetical protein
VITVGKMTVSTLPGARTHHEQAQAMDEARVAPDHPIVAQHSNLDRILTRRIYVDCRWKAGGCMSFGDVEQVVVPGRASLSLPLRVTRRRRQLLAARDRDVKLCKLR